MKKLVNFSYGLVAVLLLSLAVLTPLGASASLIVGGGGAIGLLAYANNVTGVINEGLNKEIWLAELMEGFYADDMFISECRDLSPFVDNDKINLAEAGVNPDVLINNTTYPIDTAEREDGEIVLVIDRFDTENQHVQNADLVELAYDKVKSIVYGHKQALKMAIMEKGAHAIAPAEDGEFTPVIEATGTDNGAGLKRLKWSDVRNLQKRFDNAEIPAEGRIIIFTQQHLSDLEMEDLDRFNKVMDKGVICGFKMYALADKRLPKYDSETGDKIAFGAEPADAHTAASIAFHKDEVGRAMGTETMYHSKAEDDPIYRRDVIGFAKRAMVIPIRNKGIAAIYSPVVPEEG